MPNMFSNCFPKSGCDELRSFLTTLVVAIGFVVAAGFSTALNGQAVPSPPKGINGYTISIKDKWVNSMGFRPVRVTIATNPVRATVEDESFEISLRSRNWNNHEYLTSSNLVIPAGGKSATIEFYVNDLHTVNSYLNEITISRKGRSILVCQGFTPQTDMQPKLLLIGDEFPRAPETRNLVYRDKARSLSTQNGNYTSATPLPSLDQMIGNGLSVPNAAMGFMPGGTVVTTTPAGQRVQTTPAATGLPAKPAGTTPWMVLSLGQNSIHYSHPDDLPVNWIGYEAIERVLISYSQLESLVAKSSVHRQNLEKWVAVGGSLIVYDTGPKFENANKIWGKLTGDNQRNSPDWRVPKSPIKDIGRMLPTNLDGQSYYGLDQQYWIEPATINQEFDVSKINKWTTYSSPDRFPVKDDNPKNGKKQGGTLFGVCGYIDGQVVAVSDDMSKWTTDDWMYLHNSLVLNGDTVTNRVGLVSPSSQNGYFSIPGIGEPPRGTFQVLIGLFLLVAGPVTMLMLKRIEQMQYLFVAVPLLSVAVCSSLFLYAIFADGSKKWGRVSSVTHLDHRTNMAVTHARSTYYSGKNPGEYELAPDTIGIHYLQSEMNRDVRTRYSNGVMALSGGEISARMPHEICTSRPYSTKERLLITPIADGESVAERQDDSTTTPKKRIKAQNRLGASVRLVIIKSGDKYFKIEDLEAGATSTGVEISNFDEDALNTGARMIHELSPMVDDRWGVSNRAVAVDSTYYDGNYGEQYRVESFIKRRQLKELLNAPNCYIAFLDELPIVSSQIEPVEYKLQCHVVRGQW